MQTQFRMDASVGLTGITAEEFDVDYQDAFVTGVASASNGTISKKQVNITGYDDIATRKRSRRLASGVLVRFSIQVIIEKLKLQRDNAFQVVSDTVKKSVESPKMKAAMNEELTKTKGSGFTPVDVSSFEASADDSDFVTTRSAAPTAAPTKKATDDDSEGMPSWSVSLLIVGGSVLLLIAIGIGCKVHSNSKSGSIAKKVKLNRVAVEPSATGAIESSTEQQTKSRNVKEHSFLTDQSVLRDKPRVSPLKEPKTEQSASNIRPKVGCFCYYDVFYISMYELIVTYLYMNQLLLILLLIFCSRLLSSLKEAWEL